MKKYIFNANHKKYIVHANTYDAAKSAIEAMTSKNMLKIDSTDDVVSELEIINALIEDERAAVSAYDVALKTLKDKIPTESYAAIKAIRNDENRHIENLQAVINGTVTEKNLKDALNPDIELDKAHIKYDGYDEPTRGKYYFEFDDKSDALKAKAHLSRVGYNVGNILQKTFNSKPYYAFYCKD